MTDSSLGMPTTAGSCALLDARPSGNCDIVNNVSSQLTSMRSILTT